MSHTEVVLGRVYRVDTGNSLRILTNNGELIVRLPGRMKAPMRAMGAALPGIGDWVIVQPSELGNEIIKVLRRKNHISRKVAGKEYKEQLVGANIDIIFIVMGLDRDYNIRRLERYLFMVSAAGAQPVVLLNKADLATADGTLKEKVSTVQAVTGDVPVHPIHALDKKGLEPIRQYLRKGTTISLVGSSGVGKSTIINGLLGEERQVTREVREKDDKGRHVTTTRELLLLPGGGVIIDNPGLREIQLWGDVGSLEDVFADIDELARQCKFKDCQHMSEPGCAVKKAVERDSVLSRARYANYLKMKKELAYLEQKTGMSSEAIEKARWKGMLKEAKYYRKHKRGQ